MTKPQPSKTKEQAKVTKTAAKAPVAKKAAAKTKPAPKAAAVKSPAKKVATPPVKAVKASVKSTQAPAKSIKAPVHPVKTVPVKAPAKQAVPKTISPKIDDFVPAKTAVRVATPYPAPKPSPLPSSRGGLTPVPQAVAPSRAALTPPKATRSSKMSALHVPSMPPAVASTAAKSSYSQIMSTPALAPPPIVTIKKDPKLANNWKTKTVDQLTDAEVQAMPDTEYMNDKQMAFFRLKLSVLKQDILNSAGETTEHLREDTVIVPDPADRATIEEEHALELRTRDRERKLLKKIEQSIVRIDAGDYGYCDETGEPIGVGRLLARPTATLSLEAQQRRELKQKMFGD